MAASGISLQPLRVPAQEPASTQRFLTRWADPLCAALLCLITLVTWFPRAAGPIDLRWDGATYYILGTSLAEGKGYRLLNEPGEVAANQYPPLLPLLVAAHQKALHTSDPVVVGIAIRRTFMLISLGYIVGAFLLARLFLSRSYAFWLALICSLNHDMFYLATLCFAELPFALLTVFFCWCQLRCDGRSWTRYLAPVFAVGAYLLRTMGIALLAAWVIEALLHRKFRAAAVRGLVALLPIICWQTYVHSVEVSPSYVHPPYAYQRDPAMFYNVSYAVNMKLKDPFRPDLGTVTPVDLLGRVARNVVVLPKTLGESVAARRSFFEGHVRALNQALKIHLFGVLPFVVFLNILGLCVLYGLWCLLRQKQWLIGLSAAFTVAAICTTPWPGQFGRYLAPILPLLLLSLLAAFRGFAARVSTLQFSGFPSWLRPVRLTAMTLILVECCLAVQSGTRNFLDPAQFRDSFRRTHPYRLMHYSIQYPQTAEALTWLRTQTDPSAIVAVTMPQWVYLQSGFKAVMPPLSTDPAKALSLIDAVPVSFVISEELLMDDNYNTFFPKLIANTPDRWKLVYSKPGSAVKLYARIGKATLGGHTVTAAN